MKKIPGIVILTIVMLCAEKNRAENHSIQHNQRKKMEHQAKENQNREYTFVISYSFETDANTLFNMWIEPKIYTRWMGPAGADMSFINADIREGGTAHWQMKTPGETTKFGKLHYKIIDPNYLLVYVQNFCDKDGNFIKAPFSNTYPDRLLLTVHFAHETDYKVKMTVKWEIFGESTEIERKTFNDMKPYMVKGWGESFEKIETLLKSKKK